jgi:hypothetical protein
MTSRELAIAPISEGGFRRAQRRLKRAAHDEIGVDAPEIEAGQRSEVSGQLANERRRAGGGATEGLPSGVLIAIGALVIVRNGLLYRQGRYGERRLARVFLVVPGMRIGACARIRPDDRRRARDEQTKEQTTAQLRQGTTHRRKHSCLAHIM